MADQTQRTKLAGRFDSSHAARLQSATLERIYRTAFGDDYPAEASPNGFFSRTVLERFCAALGLAPGRMVADLGCGHGGPGLWIASRTGADLIGIDISAVGVDLARERAIALGLGKRARFEVGDLTATGLSDASCDAVMSLDVLVFVPDKAAAMREFARILRTDGTLAFTTWEQPGYSERLGTPQLANHRPLLEMAGFEIQAYEEPADWQRQQRALTEGIIAAEMEMANDMGEAAAFGYTAMARGVLADLPVRRYVMVVARKR